MIPNKGDIVEFIKTRDYVLGINTGDRFLIEHCETCELKIRQTYICRSYENGQCCGYQIFLGQAFHKKVAYRYGMDGCFCYSGQSIIKIIHRQRIKNHILKLKENNENDCS